MNNNATTQPNSEPKTPFVLDILTEQQIKKLDGITDPTKPFRDYIGMADQQRIKKAGTYDHRFNRVSACINLMKDEGYHVGIEELKYMFESAGLWMDVLNRDFADREPRKPVKARKD
jgi:hypothetical protein